MRWEVILQNDPGASKPLRDRIDSLFAQQRASWPALCEGETSLRNLKKRTLVEGNERVVVQLNPARRRSTHAQTDVQSIAKRACFLCPENMPGEERGVAFEELTVLPNPYPVLPLHCTIADRVHRPQALSGRVDLLLRLAGAIGPDMAALYNGPRCGASAPDHFHFQACAAAEIPILSQHPTVADGHCRVAHRSFGRAMLIFASANAAEVQSDIEHTIGAMSDLEQTGDEPMINLLIHFKAGRYVAILFPRRAHRPARYFSKGPDQLAVSPAVLEMSGVLVTTDAGHFERIDAVTARSIYEEVGPSPAQFERLAAEL